MMAHVLHTHRDSTCMLVLPPAQLLREDRLVITEHSTGHQAAEPGMIHQAPCSKAPHYPQVLLAGNPACQGQRAVLISGRQCPHTCPHASHSPPAPRQ